MSIDPSGLTESQKRNLVDRLTRRVTFIKHKSNGRTYARIYYLNLSEDAIHYQGSSHRSKHEACNYGYYSSFYVMNHNIGWF